MDVEHKTFHFTLDPEFQQKIQDLEKEGWQLQPGVPPVVIYHLVKPKQAPVEAPKSALGKLIIDETKIFVRKAGESVQ